ncbi:MAG: trigger factor [Puniceicoccales bacterium]|nr:trigger factor [Puniceicoccales bacterium]
MKEEIENISDTRLNVVCVFDTCEITAESESVINKFCKEANVPGFRKGKVPKNIILSKFSDAIEKQLNSNIINRALDTLNSKTEWNIVAIVDIKRADVDGGMTCTLTLDVIPEFTLSDYKNLSVDPINVVVEEQEIQNEVRNALRRYAKYDVVERESKVGDFVKLNYTGHFDDGSMVVDTQGIPAIYRTQSNTWEEVGNAVNPGIRAIIDGIIGVKAGEKKTVSQQFETNFEVTELAGKIVNYDLEIVEIRELVLPELTEDMLQTLGVKSQDELYEKSKSLLTNYKTSQARFNQREELVTKLIESMDVKIPESAIDQEASNLMNEFADRKVRSGAKLEDIERLSHEIFNSFRPIATKRVKIGAILDKIAKDEKIELLRNDIENMLWQDVYTKKVDVNKYIIELRKDNNKTIDLRRRALRGKTLDHLMHMLCKDLCEENTTDGERNDEKSTEILEEVSSSEQ